MRFLAGARPGSDTPAATVVCHFRIVVWEGLIEIVTLFQHHSSTTRVWVSELILQVRAGFFRRRINFAQFHSNQIRDAFSSLQSIVLPSQVQLIDGSFGSVNLSKCLIESVNRRFVFDKILLLTVVDHRFIRNFSGSFHIIIPHDNSFQLLLSDPSSCAMFHRRRRLRKSGITVDFQGILRFASCLPHLKDFVLDLSGFEERSVIDRNDLSEGHLSPRAN
jgi:hypothetical protein